jgi:hypothetical protein
MSERDDDVELVFDAELVEVSFTAESNLVGKIPENPKALLRSMMTRQELFGSPVPEGYVPPPGIDLDALLKQLPPPRSTAQG